MPSADHARKELLFKIVYYGPGLGGKTTNLEYIHNRSRPEHRGKLLSLCTESERTLFFDLLPVSLRPFRGYSIRLHLCTVPGQVFQDKTRRLVLTNVDGVVFVADSQEAALDSNFESIENLRANLSLHGMNPATTPSAVQYNKRDLDTALPVEVLRAELGVSPDVAQLEASARFGIGVFETLKAIVGECLKSVGQPSCLPRGRSPSILPGHRPSMYPGALHPGALATSAPSTRRAGMASAGYVGGAALERAAVDDDEQTLELPPVVARAKPAVESNDAYDDVFATD